MQLGQRIKTARLEMGLSQRQLCGDTITRNMLSQIENGSARPSMDTLAYFAGQLGKPMSYFLEENAVTSPNQECMTQVRQAFAEGNYDRVKRILSQYHTPDVTFDWEKAFLQTVTDLELADVAIRENRIPYALSLLEDAVQSGERTPYYTKALKSKQNLLLIQCGAMADYPDLDPVLLLKARGMLAQGNYLRAGEYLDACEERTPLWHLLRGQVWLRIGDHRQAAQTLQRAESDFPDQTAPLLEECYIALEDYKMAYVYACKQKK